VEFSAELLFPGDVSASFYNSFVAQHQQLLHISGSKGNLHVSDFVLPFFGSELTFDTYNSDFRANGCDFSMEPHRVRHSVYEYSNSHVNSQEANMMRTFANLVIREQLDHRWGQWAWKTQRVMDACLESARAGRAVAVE
jgi:predicted dehydrogenase